MKPSAVLFAMLATAAAFSYYHHDARLAAMLGTLLVVAIGAKVLAAGFRRR